MVAAAETRVAKTRSIIAILDTVFKLVPMQPPRRKVNDLLHLFLFYTRYILHLGKVIFVTCYLAAIAINIGIHGQRSI